MMSYLGTLSEIYIYPVKSLPGIKLEKALVTKYGIAHPENPQIVDRKWMVIDTTTNSFLTQRQLPKMALIKLEIENNQLVFTAEGREKIKLPNQSSQNKVNCRVWESYIDGYTYGGQISKWLSEFLERDDVDLVTFQDSLRPRYVKDLSEKGNDARESDTTIYNDYSPFMLISNKSLNDLNAKLEKKVSMRNFRPNFVIDDCSQPYSEDSWEKFKIGETVFVKIKHCTRCLLTTVDPNKGVKDPDQQPLKTLKEYRLKPEVYGTSPMFGINLSCDNPGFLVREGEKISEFQLIN